MPWKDPEKVRAKNKRWREANPDYFKKWLKDNREKMRAAKYRYYHDPANREKITARIKLRTAVRKGEIQKLKNCQWCLVNCTVEAHHDDYSKPLEVVWLCRSCHIRKHSYT